MVRWYRRQSGCPVDGASRPQPNRLLQRKTPQLPLPHPRRRPALQARSPDYLSDIGCKSKRIPPRCPEANGYVESFIKTFKTECLNHLIITSVEQLRYVVSEFLLYYNHERPHSGLGGKLIAPWPQPTHGEIRCFSCLGGLLKSYRRVA